MTVMNDLRILEEDALKDEVNRVLDRIIEFRISDKKDRCICVVFIADDSSDDTGKLEAWDCRGEVPDMHNDDSHMIYWERGWNNVEGLGGGYYFTVKTIDEVMDDQREWFRKEGWCDVYRVMRTNVARNKRGNRPLSWTQLDYLQYDLGVENLTTVGMPPDDEMIHAIREAARRRQLEDKLKQCSQTSMPPSAEVDFEW